MCRSCQTRLGSSTTRLNYMAAMYDWIFRYLDQQAKRYEKTSKTTAETKKDRQARTLAALSKFKNKLSGALTNAASSSANWSMNTMCPYAVAAVCTLPPNLMTRPVDAGAGACACACACACAVRAVLLVLVMVPVRRRQITLWPKRKSPTTMTSSRKDG